MFKDEIVYMELIICIYMFGNDMCVLMCVVI